MYSVFHTIDAYITYVTSTESANSQSVYAVLSNGRVISWGANYNGNNGVGSMNLGLLSPMYVNLPFNENFVSVMAGYGVACFVTDVGNVYCCGQNNQKQLGRATLNAPFT